MEMKYDLATNFDDALIDGIAGFGVVKAVYGKLASDIIGGGRPSFNLPQISKKRLEQHITKAHEEGIKFSYLLNALCSDNREFIASSNREIRDFVKYLRDISTDSVTVGSPFMLGLVKETAPDLEVCASVYNDVDSLDKIRAWQALGADELTLHYSYNRNFRKLAEALNATDLSLRLIANNTCLHECIYRTNHANALAHSSQSGHESGGFFLDFYSLNCGREKLASPGKFIAADWIRPEDVHYYEELCDKLGKENLCLKLTDRARPTSWLVRALKAYAEEEYEGNLFDILNYRSSEFANVSKAPFVKGAILGKARTTKMLAMQKAIFPPRVFLDNRKLDSFMVPFVNGRECDSLDCDIEGWKADSKTSRKGSCNYCRTTAEKFLSFEGGEEARKQALEKASESVKDLTSGEMF